MFSILHGCDLKHLTAGLPSYPIGHVHIGLCIFAWHLAVSAHALVNSHGSWHTDMKQASDSKQSESDSHGWGAFGLPGSNIHVIDKCIRNYCYIFIEIFWNIFLKFC